MTLRDVTSGHHDDVDEITDLLARYANRLDRSDHDGWIGLFTDDGRFEVFGRRFEGAEGLRHMVSTAPSGLHLGGAPVIAIDGDRAAVQQSFLFVDQITHQTRIGWYDDVVVRTPAGWRFAVRRSTFLTREGPSDRP